VGFLPCLGSWFWRFRWCHWVQLQGWWFYQWGFWRRSAYHLEDEGRDGGLILSGCCNRSMYDHLQVAYRRRLNVVGLVEFLLCPGSWFWRFRWCHWVQLPMWWFSQWGFWRRFAYLLEDVGRDEGWTPSGCCNHSKYGHLPTAYQQKLNVVGLVGFLPCPGSWFWHFRWYHWVRLQGWWFYQWEFWRRSAYLHEDEGRDEGWIPFGCCSHLGYVHLLIAFLRRLNAVGLVGCLLYLEFWFSRFRWCHLARLPTWWFCQSGF